MVTALVSDLLPAIFCTLCMFDISRTHIRDTLTNKNKFSPQIILSCEIILNVSI